MQQSVDEGVRAGRSRLRTWNRGSGLTDSRVTNASDGVRQGSCTCAVRVDTGNALSGMASTAPSDAVGSLSPIAAVVMTIVLPVRQTLLGCLAGGSRVRTCVPSGAY